MKRKERENARILQIVPAQPGWEVVWTYDPEEVEDESFFTQPVACWALVELENRRFVTALYTGEDSSELLLAYDSIGNFLGYAHPGLPSSDPFWGKEADNYRGMIMKERADEDQSKEEPETN
jgi:hypothetical protein